MTRFKPQRGKFTHVDEVVFNDEEGVFQTPTG